MFPELSLITVNIVTLREYLGIIPEIFHDYWVVVNYKDISFRVYSVVN